MALVNWCGPAAMLFALLVSRPALAQDVAQWRASVEEASRRFGVPVAWIESVMRAESAGKTRLGGRPIVSSAGAMGLMQLMPATWRDVRAKLGLGHDPHEPRDNILAGTYYLRMMHDQFGYPGLFAAYNAGPGRYEQYLRGGRRLPAETRAYVLAVAGSASPRRGAGSAAASMTLSETNSALLASGRNPVGELFFARRSLPSDADILGARATSILFAIGNRSNDH